MRIAVDLMGSDAPPELLFEGVLNAAQLPEIQTLIVIATSRTLEKLQYSELPGNVHFLVSPNYIKMDDLPLKAVRSKKKASMQLGLGLLKDKQVDAFVSAGNTGALVLAANRILPTLTSINRPALLALIPTLKNPVAVLDVGGSIQCTSKNLIDFARLGAAFQRSYLEIARPKVAILNIGTEETKGRKEIQETFHALKELSKTSYKKDMRFIGNIESKDVFEGKADVLITDGFTGNIFLKTAEGTAFFILSTLEKKILPAKNIIIEAAEFENLKNNFDSTNQPGAILCGLEGIVIKCHGKATPQSIFHGIKGACHLIKNRFNEKITELLE